MAILIRTADLNDLDAVLIELKKFSDFFQSKHQLFGADEAYNRNLISGFIKDHLFYVADHGGQIVGFIMGMVTPHLFNPKIRVLTELFWWIKPEHRGSRAGAMLLKAFTDFGKANCDWVIMTLEEISPVKKESLLKRGFKTKETAFMMEI